MKKIILSLCFFIIPVFVLAAPITNYLESDVYFGLSKDNGEIISESEFKKFEDTVIINNFKSGFTVEKGQGEWLSKK